MTVFTKNIQIKSKSENDIIEITDEVTKTVKESKIQNGAVVVFVVGSTAAITTIEYEPGLQKDFPKMLSRLAPKDIEYAHDNTWHDGNGHSHVRASLIGPGITIPFVEGHLTLGTWQQIVLIEMDTRPRERKIIIQVIGG
ncbi:MAG: secondary thiamine-phosphate synthase enzyme YjbQ [Thermoproteota archaeon]|nr:YjbQ family protein [Nitrosopumilus sp.]MDQ3084642.1 secondary thiamine-phosphate synthase enzyme YjbQ [Thermoproteota archaeon]